MGRISTDLDDFMTGLHGATVDDTLDGAVQSLQQMEWTAILKA